MTPVRTINVFVSSAMAELEYDREIVHQALLEMNVNPVLFEVLPAMSQSPSDSFLDEIRDCDIFAMLLWKSLRPAVLEEYTEALKRNKPILILVKSLIENEEREPELKDFLSEVCAGSQRYVVRRTTLRHYRRVLELKSAIRDSVSVEVAKFYREPVQTRTREEMYELGTSMIRRAQKRLYLFQRTPSVILGARDYLADERAKYAYEQEFAGVLNSWIMESYSAADKEFVHLFSAEATRQEIERNGLADHPDYIARLKERIGRLKEVEVQSGFRFRIGMMDVPVSGPIIVGDNCYALGLLGGDDAVSISQENEKICSILVRMLKVHSQKTSRKEEIINGLGLSWDG